MNPAKITPIVSNQSLDWQIDLANQYAILKLIHNVPELADYGVNFRQVSRV